LNFISLTVFSFTGKGKQSDYEIISYGSGLGTPFDFESIMNYGSQYNPLKPKHTVSVIRGHWYRKGADILSAFDIRAIQQLYGCSVTPIG
jgi:hypothetical protein